MHRLVKWGLLGVWLLGYSIDVFAMGPGMYWGLGLGPANNHASDQQAQTLNSATTVTASPKSQQFGSRFFIGYMPVPYAGFELGSTFFSNISYVTSQNAILCGSTDVRIRSLELVGKGVYPFKNRLSAFNAFGKIGAALVYQTDGGALNPTGTTACGKSTYITKYTPTADIGVGYDITQNWATDFTIHYVQTSGKVSAMTMYGLELSYHFADTFCGQFLCND